MKSPFTGGKVILEKELRTHEFRGSNIEIMHHYYRCQDTGEVFSDTLLDELNLNQLHNRYREKEGIPYKDEIIQYRSQYGIPATKMSLILGLGVNMYGKYEAGEIPNISNGRMIRSICSNPDIFRHFFLCNSSKFDEKEKTSILKKIDTAIEKKDSLKDEAYKEYAALGHVSRGEFTGYVKPDLNKARQMVLFFASQLEPFVTKMNKLLFYADFFHYKNTGYAISGISYKAITNGPVPQHYAGLIDNTSDIVDRKDEFYPNDITGERLIARADFDALFFTKDEINTLMTVASRFKKTTTKEIVALSHEENAWIKNIDNHNMISYLDAFTLKAI